jgi:hypothetical protein
LASKYFFHLVEGGSGLEPLNLLLVEGMVQGDVFGASVAVLQGGDKGLENFTFKIKLCGNFSFLSNPFSKCSETKTLPLDTNYSTSVSKIGGKLVTAFLLNTLGQQSRRTHIFFTFFDAFFPKLYSSLSSSNLHIICALMKTKLERFFLVKAYLPV